MAGRQEIRDIWQAEGDVTLTFNMLDGASPLDITGWALSFRVGLAGNKALVTKTVGGGITITDGPNGQIEVVLSAADLDLIAAGYRWELRRTDSGDVRTLLYGDFALSDSLFGD